MLCNKCQNSLYGQAFTTTNCKKCDKTIVTGHIPGHVLCEECAGEEYCEQCGELLNNRIELFTTITGSANYNLMNENSDIDKKTYVLPTMNDLYNKESICKVKHTKILDTEVSDIRRLISQLKKGSVNAIETLFSDGLEINPDLELQTYLKLNKILQLKDEIARMNLVGVLHSLYGIAINNLNIVNSIPYFEGIDYDYKGKRICQGIRGLLTIKRFADNKFTDYKSAIYYKDSEPDRQILMDIKNCKMHKDDIVILGTRLIQDIIENYKSLYEKKYNKDLADFLENSVKDMIKINL